MMFNKKDVMLMIGAGVAIVIATEVIVWLIV